MSLLNNHRSVCALKRNASCITRQIPTYGFPLSVEPPIINVIPSCDMAAWEYLPCTSLPMLDHAPFEYLAIVA